MAAPEQFPWRFVDVAAVREDRAFMAASPAHEDDDDPPVGAVLSWNGAWSRKAFAIGPVALCLQTRPDTALLMLGHDGRVVRWGAKDFSEEHIDAGSDDPRLGGGMRDIQVIGDRVYAVGMGRCVYRCDGEAHWVRIDAGVRVAAPDDTGAGFNAIDGFGADALFAAGWHGELWCFDGTQWVRERSPTTLALHRVVCGADGVVYAAGQQGTLLVRRDAQWQLLPQALTRQDFWGACWFAGRLHLCTASALFVLDGEALQEIPLEPEISRASGLHRLSASAEAIWAVGDRIAIRSTDGRRWQEMPYA
ncbi:hypothetical protein [Luteimonas sp. FCS-9]|uniref:hypothetical protein n=1 Tax=Luteimonas sp. FCS-9 TaxID=1547516 RepID=UPI00069B17A9|nr:hypothetical protein [Luteimonas sp. FCS-9]